ncbi:MAG: AAA family ATPase [Myxococcota bacterium]
MIVMQDTQMDSCIVNPQSKLPVGISNFAQVIQDGYCLVDKSLFIREVLDSGGGVTLITRPRRFGKTINLNMLSCFLSQPANAQSDLFDGLAISQQGIQYQQERGKRAVLFLSLRKVKESSWNDAYTRLIGLLSDLVQHNCQDASTGKLTDRQQRVLKEVQAGTATPAECKATLAILTELLTLKHNGMTPWVLMDEYDAPMQAAYQHGYYKQMRDLMKGLLGDCFKDNPFLHRAVLTGIVRVAKEDIFSDLNNLGVFGTLDDRFADCFGFVEHEVKQLLEQRNLSHHFETIQQAYNGYCFGHDKPAMVYNPWSVVRFVSQPTKEAPLYWVNTSDNHLVHKLLTQANPQVKQGLHELLSKTSHHSTTQILKEHVPLRFLENSSEHLWGLLLASGYVTAVSRQTKPETLEQMVKLRIPNQEVLSVYNDLLRRWLTSGSGASGASLLDALVAGQVQEFAAHFERFVYESMSYFDKQGNEPERFYHGFVLGMMHYLRDRYIVDSQRESGLGRYDLALEPKDKTLPGFVMEFKTCVRETDSLTDTVQQALQQIQDKQYHMNLMKRGVQTIIALGFAFRGKEVTVKHTTLAKT